MRKNRATTAVTPQPTVQLPDPPPGFDAPHQWEPGRVLCEDETREWRLIYYTPRHLVTDHDASVSLRAIQYSDGSLDDEIEVIVGGADSDGPLNSDQARELAAALLDAAAELDRWTD
ncbi:hypothetical protein [Mycobacterium sp. 852002-10029_SCH5224772]|uniref:hypothetical protein n=1 Tax=Mycobacterium sp. 852002-10029_SCH5224772 TaxID=1834083 RepID=UPI000AEC0848|nr:hypothetical protein [Mycobacterium sp. 852002-10029_SCH5224772]